MGERLLSLSKIDRRDQDLVGSIVAKLGELSSLGVQVGEGFVITYSFFREFLGEIDLDKKIKQQLDLYPQSAPSLASLAKKAIGAAKFPANLSEELKSFFSKRTTTSSYLVKTLINDELINETLLPERATFEMFEKCLKSSWQSALEPKFLSNQKYLETVVIFCSFPGEEISGVVYSQKPSGEKNLTVVKAVWGNIGLIEKHPEAADTFLIDQDSHEIKQKKIGQQPFQLVRTAKGLKEILVPARFSQRQKLSDQKVLELARVAKKAENHFLYPQEIAWRALGESIYIDLASNLETTINLTLSSSSLTKFLKPLFSGNSIQAGIAAGPVKLISSLKKRISVTPGSILVMKEFSRIYLPFLRKVAGVVTETSIYTKNKQIFWDLGKPVLVTTKKALETLKENQVVTLDASGGKLFAGSVNFKPILLSPSPRIISDFRALKSATKVMVSFADAPLASSVAGKKADGVGLFQSDLLTNSLGLFKNRKALAQSLENLLKNFPDQAFFYKLSENGDKETSLNLQLEAIKNARAKYRNLFIAVGGIKNPEELLSIKFSLASHRLNPSSSFQLILCLENPTNLLMIEELLKVGITGICLDEASLTKSILGKSYTSETDSRSLVSSFEPAVLLAKKNKLFTNVFLQKASSDSQLLEKSIHWGVNAITVKADEIEKARQLVAQFESSLVLEKK